MVHLAVGEKRHGDDVRFLHVLVPTGPVCTVDILFGGHLESVMPPLIAF